MITLLYHGSYNLQIQGRWLFDTESAMSTTESDVQTSPIARGIGSVVVNKRTSQKVMSFTGSIHAESGASLREQNRRFDLAWQNKDQFLRFLYNYRTLFTTDTTTGWTVSDDGANLATTETNTNYYDETIGSRSGLEFDVDVSVSGNNYATITGTGLPVKDLSDVANTGNFEFTLHIPDAYDVASVDFRVGNDSSNYYSCSFTTDYQGQSFKNGMNLFSIPWDTMTETGTVTDSALDYCYIRVNYSATQADMNNIVLSGILWVDESQVRQYRGNKIGQIEKSGEHNDVVDNRYSATFLNHTGYAEGTHPKVALNLAGQTTTPNIQTVEYEGSFSPEPTNIITINSQTGLTDIILTNNSVNTSLKFSKIYSDGDVFRFGGDNKLSQVNTLPQNFTGQIAPANLGKNRMQLTLNDSTANEIMNEQYESSRTATVTSGTKGYIAQSFYNEINTGNVTSIAMLIPQILNIETQKRTANVYLAPDSSGSPGALTFVGTVGQSVGSALSLVQQTKFDFQATVFNTCWVVLETELRTPYIPVRISAYWSYSTSASLQNQFGAVAGAVKQSTNGGSTWSSALTGTQAVKLTITPPFSVNYDWRITYKPRYE
jgi:hypothetical protein